jgi:hypothetical protein
MLLDKNIQFSNLNSVFILEFNNIAVSSTAGFIICGNYEQNYFKSNSVLAIPLFETYKICLAFYDIINFFSNDDIVTTNSETIVNLNNEVLYWKGDTLYKDSNETEKRIQICFECEVSNYKFDIMFTNFQNFIIAIDKVIRSAFCFKLEDNLFVNFVLKQPMNVILTYTDDFEAYKCSKLFNDTYKQQFCECLKIEFLQYYLEIILVLKKISLLVMDKYPRKDIFKTLL